MKLLGSTFCGLSCASRGNTCDAYKLISSIGEIKRIIRASSIHSSGHNCCCHRWNSGICGQIWSELSWAWSRGEDTGKWGSERSSNGFSGTCACSWSSSYNLHAGAHSMAIDIVVAIDLTEFFSAATKSLLSSLGECWCGGPSCEAIINSTRCEEDYIILSHCNTWRGGRWCLKLNTPAF